MAVEEILKRSRAIEGHLAKLGATGKGLHEKATSIENALDEQTIKKIRFIASIRNKAVHVDDFHLPETTLDGYMTACDEVDDELNAILNKRSLKASTSASSPISTNSFSEASPVQKVVMVGSALAALAAFVMSLRQ